MVRLSVGIFKAEGKADDTTETTFKTIQNSSLPLPKASPCQPTVPFNDAPQVKLFFEAAHIHASRVPPSGPRVSPFEKTRVPPIGTPFDPFGTAAYISLPGPSSPYFAFPVTTDNPHLHE